jgi:hypothetical protein
MKITSTTVDIFPHRVKGIHKKLLILQKEFKDENRNVRKRKGGGR